MADSKPQRSCLPRGAQLTIVAENGNRYQLTIKDTISSSGGSCIVYHGTYHIELGINPDVIVKEFFPRELSLTRSDSGALEICEADRALFEEREERFASGIEEHINNYNHYKRYITPPPFVFGRANNTIYAIYGHSEGTVLSKLQHSTSSLWDMLSLMQRLCQIAFDLHTDGKVYLDFKPENVYIFREDYGWDVKLFDFDTLASEEDIQKQKAPCAFTPAWAAPEQIPPKGASYFAMPHLVGFHSDIFSLGLIFYWMLTGKEPSADSSERQAMIGNICQGTVNWQEISPMCAGCTPEQITEIRTLLAKMLEPDAGQRRVHFRSDAQKKKLTKRFQALRDSVPRPVASAAAIPHKVPRPDAATVTMRPMGSRAPETPDIESPRQEACPDAAAACKKEEPPRKAAEMTVEQGVLTRYAGPGGQVQIPAGVTKIGAHAFEGCCTLTGITFPEGLTEIGDGAFQCCASLVSVSLPGSVRAIGDSTFAFCISLRSVMLSEQITEIGAHAFMGCSALTGIVLPKRVTELPRSVFEGCSALTGITLAAGTVKIGDYALARCSALERVTIPEGAVELGWSAFAHCTAMTSITIPQGATEIGPHAFEGCTSLKKLVCPGQLFTGDNFGDTPAWRARNA